MAPPGRSRLDLAQALAQRHDGLVQRFFHPQSEPSKVPGQAIFENLTLGFNVVTESGNLIARCVDDLTLQDTLDKNASPQPGWYRIVSDDKRFINLIIQQANADDDLEQVLLPIARLFGTEPDFNEHDMVRIGDVHGAAIAMGAPLPGERERPCEIITPPLEQSHAARLDALLEPARALGFTIPSEGATHIHYDAQALCSPYVLANLVSLLWIHGDGLRRLVGTNPRCRRLGKWPDELYPLVQSPLFLNADWPTAREQLRKLKLTKYCDFNLSNFIYGLPGKNTFEVRILPVWLETEAIIAAAALFESILRWALTGKQTLKPVPGGLQQLLFELALDKALHDYWTRRIIPSATA